MHPILSLRFHCIYILYMYVSDVSLVRFVCVKEGWILV